MRKIILLLCSVFIVACGSGGGGGTTQSNSVIGSWSFIYPSIQCTETYIFNSNNTWSATSLDEVFGGTYSFTAQENTSNRHPMSLTWTDDNQQSDCEGSTTSEIGQVVDLFVEFVTPTEMDWYLQSSGGTPVITLNKN